MTILLRVLALVALVGFTAIADEKHAAKPCATAGFVVFPGLTASDLKAIQAAVDKFMADVRARCLDSEGT